MLKVTIEGADELIRKFKNLSDELMLDALAKASAKGAELVKDATKAKAPRDTGKLAEGIAVTKNAKGKKGVLSEVSTADPDTYYGVFHEYGTAKMPKHPFMRPALDENQNKIQELFKEAIREAVENCEVGK